ncbi:MAG: hypothetical protein Q4P30_04160 [Eubacteriales bacterium]|nr:hypothetical protein [Eubacteriales bacterium]
MDVFSKRMEDVLHPLGGYEHIIYIVAGVIIMLTVLYIFFHAKK